MSDEKKLSCAMEKLGDMIFRYCLFLLKNHADAEDTVQDVFLIYYRKSPEFTDSEHEKAWLMRVAANKCRDLHRFRKRHMTEPEELLNSVIFEEEDKSVLEALLEVPEKFREPLNLHYIEGFKTNEIAEIMGISQSAVKMRLAKGRKLFEKIYSEV